MAILTLNGGSSSIRFGVYDADERRLVAGKIERIGAHGTTLDVDGETLRVPGRDPRAAIAFLVGWLEAQPFFEGLVAVGHRIVHGGAHAGPARLTATLRRQLGRMTAYAPEHLPRELALVDAISARHPRLAQVLCFDTSFHRGMPAVARRLPIPRRYAKAGIERYGFHGLSYAYLMEALARLEPRRAKGRVILAHLGSGASMAAVHRGKSIDTSMSFTPTAGLVMGTRTGDLDPGLAYYLARTEGMSAARFQHMVNHESGLLGVSGTSADVRDLEAKKTAAAREAVALFCYQAKKRIGAYAAALGGLDLLVFSAGIGEHAPSVRRAICEGLGFLGVELDAARNAKSAPVISRATAAVQVRVLPTDEEIMIARSTARLLAGRKRKTR